ncbi:hypothetical protein AaE_013269 [Aphanomyces astaci]|uniref:Nucleoside diphosphate kinase-like domain-containing protein n=1 Tax=Aphanomyces astaci TaxID=112090 RepID=A0A6A4Z4K6_APHAT|nr:hypothetical protein AaE_013269 [Aphanomyces astaci]
MDRGFPSLKVVDLFVGACVSVYVYSRQINLVDCANEYTRHLLASRGTNSLFLIKPRGTNSLFLIKPAGYRSLGRILSALEGCHLALVKMRMIHIKTTDLPLVSKHIDSIDPSPASAQEWTRDFSVAIEVSIGAPAAVADALRQLGTVPLEILSSPVALRLASSTPTRFPPPPPWTTAPRSASSDHEWSRPELVKYMSSAPLKSEADIVPRFQSFCGPFDVHVARELAPTTLRGIYGHTNMQNAVHCTDSPEDGSLETQFFFRVAGIIHMFVNVTGVYYSHNVRESDTFHRIMPPTTNKSRLLA